MPHRPGAERATVPEIVLPVTSRGLAVNDRLCWSLLGAAMAAAAGLILYLNRGTIFYVDELERFLATPGLTLVDALEPHGGHLTATSNLLFKAILETVGSEYLAFRIVAVLVVLTAVALFYALAKRRLGALPALAPALVLLFLGSSWEMIASPLGFNVVSSTAAGLGALLALERGERRGDLVATVLLVLAVATFSVGLAFVVGAATSVLVRPDRRRRAWIFLVPVVLYLAWWSWALPREDSVEQGAQLSNLLLVPSYVADSLAAVTASVAGLGYDFADPLSGVDPGWGYVLALLALAGLVLRLTRGGRAPDSLWASIAIALTLWILGALVIDLLRGPGAQRYVYAGAVAVLLAATSAAAGVRFTRLGLIALFVACAISLAGNLALLRSGAAFLRDYSATVRAHLGVAELARPHVDPEFRLLAGASLAEFTDAPASAYFEAADRYGSIGFSPEQLQAQPENVRQAADGVLVEALDLRLVDRGSPLGGRGCRLVRPEAEGEPASFELPPGGARLEARGPTPAQLTLARFASVPATELGELLPGEPAMLEIPPDSSPVPWVASVRGADSLQVCASR